MKAIDYVEKYKEGLSSEETINKSVCLLCQELIDEILELTKKRNIQRFKGLLSIIRESNEKYILISKILEREYNLPVLREDGYLKYLELKLDMKLGA